MLNWFYKEMEKLGNIRQREISPYDKIDKGLLHFKINAYELEELGTFSTIEMKAMFGLMKMKTIIFTPLNKDLPLLSYDYIHALGNDTLLLELYDTNLEKVEFDEMNKIKEKYSYLPNNKLSSNWYDNLKLSPTLSKKGKKLKNEFENLSKDWISSFINMINKAKDSDKSLKEAKVKEYVDGLFLHGGPSTDQFKKMIGDKAAYDLFSHYIFGANSKIS